MTRFPPATSLAAALLAAGPASAASVEVTLTNLQPAGGLAATPVWLGFHDDTSFDLFTTGELASAGLERIAEDGTFAVIREEFAAATGGTGLGAVVTAPNGFAGAPVFEPGESVSTTFEIDTGSQRFLQLAGMVLPSNDFFFGNNDAIELYDGDGAFTGDRSITLSRIYDAGTEANTELDAAFLNQTGPDAGITTSSVITLADGFIGSVGGPATGPNGEAASVLGGTAASGAVIDPVLGDFSASRFRRVLPCRHPRGERGADALRRSHRRARPRRPAGPPPACVSSVLGFLRESTALFPRKADPREGSAPGGGRARCADGSVALGEARCGSGRASTMTPPLPTAARIAIGTTPLARPPDRPTVDRSRRSRNKRQTAAGG